jgi:hypothetical protein
MYLLDANSIGSCLKILLIDSQYPHTAECQNPFFQRSIIPTFQLEQGS